MGAVNWGVPFLNHNTDRNGDEAEGTELERGNWCEVSTAFGEQSVLPALP